LRDHEAEFFRRKINVVVVSFEANSLARSYAQETSLFWPLLVDETRETYRAYGMLSASFLDVFGPRTLWLYLKAIMKGEKLHKSQGDIFQRGGDVLIDPQGIVRLHHVGKNPVDRPSVEAIIEKIDR